MLSTLIILLSGASLCLVLLLVLLSLRRTQIAGVSEWCWANVLAIAAFILYAFGRQLPPVFAYELANGVYLGAAAAVLAGYRRIFLQPVSVRLLGAAIAAATGGIAWFHYVQPSFFVRTAIVSAFYVVVCCAIGVSVFRARKQWTSLYPYAFSGGMAFVVAFGHGVRGILQGLAPQAPTSLLEPSGWSLIVLSASILVMPVLTLGAVMIVHGRMLAKSELAANRDFLTGAWSRRAFWEVAERELARANRSGHPVSLLVMDIDYFKRINDAFGHAEGDRVLVDMVLRVESVMRHIDYFARIGGEEFAVLMPETNREAALAFAERLRRALSQPRTLPPGADPAQCAHTYTVSIGVGILRSTDSFQDLLQRSDAALYCAKTAGRNRVICEQALDC